MTPYPSVTLEFKGRDYVVPADRLWGLCWEIEQYCSLAKIFLMIEDQNPARTRLIAAYHAALSYAGCDASRKEVNAEIALLDVWALCATITDILKLIEPPRDADTPKATEKEIKKPPARARKAPSGRR